MEKDGGDKKQLSEESSSRLFRRIIGFILTLYGFFAFVDPETYSFGIVPTKLAPIVGLGFMMFGLFLILKGRGIFG